MVLNHPNHQILLYIAIKKMNSAEYLKAKNLRKCETDEIIIDIDDRTENGLLCYMQTGINLVNVGYHIEIWFAEGMKEPHIHIKGIANLNSLTQEQGTVYRKLFFDKFIPKEFWNDKIPDYSMSKKYEEKFHPVAEENKPHHKYKTLKLLRSEFNKCAVNQVEMDLWDKATTTQTTKFHYTPQEKNLSYDAPLFRKIAREISIFKIADDFGIKPFGKKLRFCPFHADTKPSLSLNEELGVFNCFGCHTKGNIILFYALLKKLNPNFKIRVEK